MKMAAHPMLKALAVGFVVFVVSMQIGFCQSGPPPLPPDPFLGAYYFDVTNWLSVDGDAPIAFTNLVSVALWNKNALLLDMTNAVPAFLNYNVIETDGFVNITFDQGAFRCVYVSDWATADTNQNGTGPGQLCYLIAAGDFTAGSPDGLWTVTIDSGGSNIYFGGVSNSTANVFVSAPISWPSNSIHLIAAEYSATNSVLYLDGQVAATGGPVTIVPATNTWTNGFFIGSDASGYEQARGIFSSVEFFNSNCFDPDWSEFFTDGFLFTNGWPRLTNAYYTWLAGGGSPDSSGGSGSLLSGGGSGDCVTGSNPFDVYMTNMSSGFVAGQGNTFTFTITGGVAGYSYDVFATTNLIGAGVSNAVWTWLGRGTNCGIYYVTNQPNNPSFYLLGTPLLATNNGGLTVAYENLISTNISSDGYGTPNAWYLWEGINPQIAGIATNDPDGDTLLNWQEYLYGSNPLVSEGFSVWVADPATISGIP